MSSQNDNSGASFGIAVVLAGLYFIGLFLFALAAFAAFVMTILSLLAWRKPLHLGKDMVVTPEEAHAFVKRGLIGAVAAPAFVVFSALLLDFDIRDDAWGYIILGGYILGSLILGLIIESQRQEEEKAKAAMLAMLPPAPPQVPAPREQASAKREVGEFRFASWDDEEELNERS